MNAADLIPVCAEGVRETVHPLSFVARQMLKELLANPVGTRVCVYVCWLSRSLFTSSFEPDSWQLCCVYAVAFCYYSLLCG